jgi:hypothetical protein
MARFDPRAARHLTRNHAVARHAGRFLRLGPTPLAMINVSGLLMLQRNLKWPQILITAGLHRPRRRPDGEGGSARPGQAVRIPHRNPDLTGVAFRRQGWG